MRKLALVALSTAVMLSFVACGKDNGNNSENITPTPVEEQDNTTEDVTDEGVEEDTTGEDAQTSDLNADEMQKLQAYRDAVAEEFGEAYIPSMLYSQEEVAELFGVNADLYDAIIAEGPMMSVHIDKFIAIHPTEGNLDAVVEALEAYQATIQADTMQYPMNLTKIQGCRVETMGDYVFFLMVGSSDEMFDTEEEEVAAYEAFNQKAVDAIQAVMDAE